MNSTLCCMLLRVVGSFCAKCETGQTSVSRVMLDPFVQLFQHCWVRAGALHLVSKVLWVLSFPRCTAGSFTVGSCCIRLYALPTRTQQLPALLAQHYWDLLYPFARSFTPTMHSVGQRRTISQPFRILKSHLSAVLRQSHLGGDFRDLG